MSVLVYKDGIAFAEINGRKLKSDMRPYLSFEYDELYYTQTQQHYLRNFEHIALNHNQIQEIESFISNIDENTNLTVIKSLQKYLAQTDWMVIREVETGKKVPEHIKEERARAREKLNKIKG